MTTDALKDFRGPEPDKDGDKAPSPPVADDDHSSTDQPVVEDVTVAGVEPEKKEPAPPAPKLSPFDAKRARIAERFAERRKTEFQDGADPDTTNPDGIYGKLAGEGGDPPAGDGAEKPDATLAAPAKPGPSDSGDKPEPLTLAVNGRTLSKTLAEVAALADMTEDEVKADPARAKKYAQRELATADNLERSRIARRDLPARQQDDSGTRPERSGPNQDRQEAGNDDPDRQPASRDTSDDDMAKLIEEIQIGDPKDVAPKLTALLAKVAEDGVKRTHGDTLRRDELNSNISAVKEFLDEHPELEGKPAIAAAISGKMDEEYRSDLRTVLINEGETPDDADRLLSQASRDQIRNAHLARRLDRNPHTRKIDKAFIGDVFDKVRADFGVTVEPKQQQDLSRQARKEALPQQPRRAAVPPATTQANPTAPLSRRAVVAEMATRTGKKRAVLPR